MYKSLIARRAAVADKSITKNSTHTHTPRQTKLLNSRKALVKSINYDGTSDSERHKRLYKLNK